MKNAPWLLETLRSVSDNSVKRSGLNRLIEFTQGFASTYLKHRYKNLSRTITGDNLTFDEMAIDAIAPLFERDETGAFIKIIKAFESWEPEIENENQAVFFINRLAAKSAEKYVSELLRESDPFFSRILRSVNYLVNRDGYIKKQILGTTYIVTGEQLDISSLPSAQFIYDLPAHLLDEKSNVLKEIFTYIKLNTEKSAAIPLYALVIKLKKTGTTGFDPGSETEFRSAFEIESIVNKAVHNAYGRLEKSYLEKNKINEKEANALKRALWKIVRDMQDGGTNTGLHKYLIEEIPELSFQDYSKKYQNIFEYLYKVLKKEIIEQIEN